MNAENLRTVISMLFSIGAFLLAVWCWVYLNDDRQASSDYLRAAMVVLTSIGLFLSASLSCYAMNEHNPLRGYYQWSTKTAFSIIELFLLSFCRWCDIIDENKKKFQSLSSAMGISKVDFFLLSFWILYWVNDESHKRWYYIRSIAALLLLTGYFHIAFWSCCWYVNDENKLRSCYLRLNIALFITSGFFLAAFWCWDIMHGVDWHCRYYLRFTKEWPSTITSFLLTLWCCYLTNDDDHQRRFYWIITLSVPFIMLASLQVLWSWCYMDYNDQLRWWFMETVTGVLSITFSVRPDLMNWCWWRATCLMYYFYLQKMLNVSEGFLQRICIVYCLRWDVLCWRSPTTKVVDATGEILWYSTRDFYGETNYSPIPKRHLRAKQNAGMVKIRSKRDTQVPSEQIDRLLMDVIGVANSGGWRNIGDGHRKGEAFNVVDRSSLPQYSNLNVFVQTHDGKRIQVSMSLQNTIFDVRRKIYNILCIPLNQCRLFSCGSRLLWDSRTLAYYDFKD